MISKRTKLEAVGLVLLMLCISIGSVYGTLSKDPSGTTPGNGFINPNYIWNSNGQSWVATGPNIQASLNLSGTTYLPAKTIYINTSLLMGNNSCLAGQGWTTIIKAGAGLGNVPLIVNDANYPPTHTNHHIEVRNLQVDGSDPTHAKAVGGFNYGVLFAKVTWGTVDNVLVKDLGKDGVRAFNSNHISVSYITANNTGIHSIFMGYGTTNSSISHIIANDANKEAVCVEWSELGTSRRNEYITVSDVICYNNEQHGLYVQDTNYITISSYIAANPAAIGIAIVNSSYVTLTDCQVYGTKGVNGGVGFYVASTSNHAHLTNCVANDIVSTGVVYAAYDLAGQNITLQNSVGSNCGRPFITKTTARNVTVSHCTFFDYGAYSSIYGKDIEVSYNRFLKTKGALNRIIVVESTAARVNVIGNDVTDAACVNRKILDSSNTAVVKDNPGFPTSYYCRNGGTVPIGLNNAYGSALSLSPLTRSIVAPRLWFRQIGTVNALEIITIKIQTIYYTGTVKYLNVTMTGPSAPLVYWYNVTDTDWFTLASLTQYTGGERLEKINIYAKTTNATTSADVRAYLLIQG